MTISAWNHSQNLSQHYQAFQVQERTLLTGHSHQAWPDCSFDAVKEAWMDAATHVDGKWEKAFQKAQVVQQAYATLLDDHDGHIALGQNAHEMSVRFLSALPLKQKSQLLTTDGEFHSLRRQLDRLEEEGIEIVRIPSIPHEDVVPQLIDALSNKTAAVLVSSVFFHTGCLLPHLTELMQACTRNGTELLIDTYHHLNVVPFSVKEWGLEKAFIVGGGYKYLQFGEGNAFLRFPAEGSWRPVITGWFSEFEHLEDKPLKPVVYGSGPMQFAGSTYDPTSHYRAAAVSQFFKEQKLSPQYLRELSQSQMGYLLEEFENLDLDPAIIRVKQSMPLSSYAGFLSLETPYATQISTLLQTQHHVHTDFRGTVLRLGPAPYVTQEQLTHALHALKQVASRL